MELHLHKDYSKNTDLELVDMIVGQPHDEEAALELLYVRYQPLILSHCRYLGIDAHLYLDDATASVFADLKGSQANWAPLATYNRQCHFPYWMKKVSYHSIYKYYCSVIANRIDAISIDEEDEDGNLVYQLSDFDEEDYDRCRRKIMLLESIAELKNADDQFCVMKHLEGYNSTEIAYMLQQRWIGAGVTKVNAQGQIVVPTRAYIDVRFSRAKDELRKIMLMKDNRPSKKNISFCGAVPRVISKNISDWAPSTEKVTYKSTFLGRLDDLLSEL